jgi:5-methylcytosine-specific restriction endonuclease McrA
MRKKLSLSSLEHKLDRVFSEYIRIRDSDGGLVTCCTCSKVMPWQQSHAGHFIKRQHRATRWVETNVHAQCVGCNTYRGGQQDEYAYFINKNYGRHAFDDLMELKRTTKKYTRSDLEELIETYKAKLSAQKEAA